MQEGKWYFDDEDSTVSVIKDGEALEVCTVCTFDQDGAHWIFGEKTKAHAALLTSAPALLEALEVMTALVRMKYGNLDADVYKEIENAESAIAAARGDV